MLILFFKVFESCTFIYLFTVRVLACLTLVLAAIVLHWAPPFIYLFVCMYTVSCKLLVTGDFLWWYTIVGIYSEHCSKEISSTVIECCFQTSTDVWKDCYHILVLQLGASPTYHHICSPPPYLTLTTSSPFFSFPHICTSTPSFTTASDIYSSPHAPTTCSTCPHYTDGYLCLLTLPLYSVLVTCPSVFTTN